MKKYLVSYKKPMLHVLSVDYIKIKLELINIHFWGLYKTNETNEVKIYDHEDSSIYFDHWDSLIKNKTLIKR